MARSKSFIYIMKAEAHSNMYKIGISDNPTRRLNTVNKSVKGKVSLVTSRKIWFAFELEQFMHGLYLPLRKKFHGSGKTEWFFFFYPLTPMLIIWLVWLFQRLFLLIIGFLILYAVFNYDALLFFFQEIVWFLKGFFR